MGCDWDLWGTPMPRSPQILTADRRSDSQRPSPYQIRQLSALLRLQHGMDLPQCLKHRLAQPLSALNSLGASLARLGLIERLTGYGIGQRRGGATPTDFGLSALGLEPVEDACQFGDLA